MSSTTRVLILMWLTTAPATAADERFELTPFSGFTTLDSRSTRDPGGGAFEFEESFSQGIQLGARFGVRVSERIALEAEYRYSPNGQILLGFTDPFFGGTDLEVPIDVGSHAITGGLLYDLTSSSGWRPFVGATLGLENFRTFDGGSTLRTSVGGGVRFPVRPGVRVRFDARYVLWPSFFLTDALEQALEPDIELSLAF